MSVRVRAIPQMVRISAKRLERLLKECYEEGRRDGVAEEVARRHRLTPPPTPRFRAPLGQPVFSQ